MDPTNKKPTTESTGYIICIYQVFKGDDGEKFERNWLYWTGQEFFSSTYKFVFFSFWSLSNGGWMAFIIRRCNK